MLCIHVALRGLTLFVRSVCPCQQVWQCCHSPSHASTSFDCSCYHVLCKLSATLLTECTTSAAPTGRRFFSCICLASLCGLAVVRVRAQALQGIILRGAVHYAMQQPNQDTLLLGSMLGVCLRCNLYFPFNHPSANNNYLILYTLD